MWTIRKCVGKHENWCWRETTINNILFHEFFHFPLNPSDARNERVNKWCLFRRAFAWQKDEGNAIFGIHSICRYLISLIMISWARTSRNINFILIGGKQKARWKKYERSKDVYLQTGNDGPELDISGGDSYAVRRVKPASHPDPAMRVSHDMAHNHSAETEYETLVFRWCTETQNALVQEPWPKREIALQHSRDKHIQSSKHSRILSIKLEWNWNINANVNTWNWTKALNWTKLNYT